MDPETPQPPPEAQLIRTAREALGLTAVQAAAATEGAVSATYWRDVERGYGGRRGQRAATRASDRLLAVMARVTGVTPEELDDAQREGAARVLRRALDGPPRLSVVPGRPTIGDLLAELPAEPTDEEFAGWIARFPAGDRIDVLAADAARKLWALDYLPPADRSRLIRVALSRPGKPGEARRSGAG